MQALMAITVALWDVFSVVTIYMSQLSNREPCPSSEISPLIGQSYSLSTLSAPPTSEEEIINCSEASCINSGYKLKPPSPSSSAQASLGIPQEEDV